jgi:hypothetical protein
VSVDKVLANIKKKIDMMSKINTKVCKMLMIGQDVVYLVSEHDNQDHLIAKAIAEYVPKGGLYKYSEDLETYINVATGNKVVIATSMQDAADKSSTEFVAKTVVVVNKWGRSE